MGEEYMKKDKEKILSMEILLVVALLLSTLLSSSKYVITTIVLVTAIFVSFLLKKKQILQIEKEKVYRIMILFGFLYIAIYYMIGLYTKFYSASTKFGIQTIGQYIIPISVIIVCTEIIRSKLIVQKEKYSKVVIVIIGTLIDVALYISMYRGADLESFLKLVGYATFASIAGNIFYTYISQHYGKKPVIAYRLITSLFPYIIPITPDVYIFYRSFFRMVYPMIMFYYIDRTLNREKEEEAKIQRKETIISYASTITILVILIGLISCKFAYGVLVIGSSSMKGSIDKGDVIFYSSKNKKVKVGDVIVFEKENTRVVHRIVEIKNTATGIQYYTKGDANSSIDKGYVGEESYIGKVLFKIEKIGKPSLWLRESFE